MKLDGGLPSVDPPSLDPPSPAPPADAAVVPGPDLLREQSAAFLAAIVESSDDAIVGKTLDGVIRSWNPAAERLFGYTADEAVGRSITLIIPEERLDEEVEILSRLRRGERIDHFETERVGKHGRRVRVALTVSPIHDASGKVVGASKIARDITDRHRAEEDARRVRAEADRAVRDSEQRFRGLADNIPQLAWMTDRTGAIVWYNQRWFDYTGTTFEEMKGWGWQAVHHADHVERVSEKFRRHIASGEVWEDTFPLRAADGVYRWFLSRAVPIRGEDGAVDRWFGTNTDITDRMRMEEALRDADRRKDEFLAVLAHELRNPLAPIRSGLEMLRLAGDDRARRERIYAVLERQTNQLVRLVEDLLDVSRVTRGKVELRPADVTLAEVLRGAVETCRPLIDGKRQRLRVEIPEEPITVHADPTRMSQVFANLLNNAANYTPEGGDIRVVAERTGGEVAVRVIDSGIGMSPETLDRVFDLFVQVGGDSALHGGLGIGLTLVKSLVELHGGTVTAASEGHGTGCTFTVRLPLAAAAAEDDGEVATVAPETPRRALRILVVDDNVDAADSLQSVLELLGHDARAVYDGNSAMAAAGELRPDVVLLDLGMPEIDGYETARRLRDLDGGDGLSLIALTGWGQEADRTRTREAGFDHHLVKPADLDELRALLAELGSAG